MGPKQVVLTYERDFAEFISRRDRGEIVEIDGEMFDYWLGVLPPVGFNGKQNGESMQMTGGMGGIWTRKDGTPQRFSFAFAEGKEMITVFWTSVWHGELLHWAQRTGIVNCRS